MIGPAPVFAVRSRGESWKNHAARGLAGRPCGPPARARQEGETVTQRGTPGRHLGFPRAGRLPALVLACAIAGTASVAWAAQTRIERGAETITPGTNNGEEGYWVEWDEYTYTEALALFNELASVLTPEERRAAEAELKKLGGSPTLDDLKKLIEKYSIGALRDMYVSIFGSAPSTSALNAMKKRIADGQLTLSQARAALTEIKSLMDLGGTPPAGGGRTLYVSSIDKVLGVTSWGPSWRDKKQWLGIGNVSTTTGYRRYYNTASSMVEAGRLARIIELLDLGLAEPGMSMNGGHYAFSQWYGYSVPVSRASLLARLQTVYQLGIDTYSPIALDLNHDGKIGVTGRSTAAVRKAGNAFVREGSVLFDLRGAGKKERYEWLNRDGDGFLVLDRDGTVTKAAAAGKDIDGHSLFGNVFGYDHGFEKLALHTAGIAVAADDLGKLDRATIEAALTRKSASGRELAPLKVWIDQNGDAKAQPSELRTLESLGITEVGLQPEFKTNEHGETIIVSYYVQNGKRYMTEDVWFASEPAGTAR